MQTPAKPAARTASKLQCLLICALACVSCIPVHAKVSAWHYNQDNQLTQYPRTVNPHIPGSQTEQTDVSYTAQGHTQKESSASWQRSYSYNASERLMQVSTQTSTQTGSGGSADSTLTVSNRYDPFGRRISKTVSEGAGANSPAKTTYYLNGDSALLAEADDEGKLTKAYGFNPNTQAQELDLWSTDAIWQAELNGKTNLSEASYHYIVTDHLGTPILATDGNGQKSWRSYSEAFGRAGIEQGSTANINLRLPGQYFDPETGLHQNWFRDYSPSRGRYVQSDPIGIWGGVNAYGYANSNPLVYYDPYGLFGMNDVWRGVDWVTRGWSPSQNTVNFWAGFGDGLSSAVTLGLFSTSHFRRAAGIGGVDECSISYLSGGISAAFIPLGYSLKSARTVLPNFSEWARNPILYEVGQKTISSASYNALNLDKFSATSKAGVILSHMGWLRVIFDLRGDWGKTISTGPTPGGLIAFSAAGIFMTGKATYDHANCECQ